MDMRYTCVLLALSLLACGQAPRPLEPDSPAPAVLNFRMALPAGVDPGEVREARLRISAPDMDALVAPLAVDGSHLVGEVEGVPAGEGRILEVFGEDAAGKRIIAGKLRADVEAGEAAIAVTLQRVGTVRLEATFDTDPFD